MPRQLAATVVVLLLGSVAGAQSVSKVIHVDVAGVKREALVYAPAGKPKAPAPVVFAFHGHGGTAEKAARMFEVQKHWPHAIVVYMQGLPIMGRNDREGKKPGWQHMVGEVEDRDLKFFDETLARLHRDYKVDDSRIYATGHSNGAIFTYVLWAARGDKFAAVAASSANAHGSLKDLKPKPALHVAGKMDEEFPYEKQRKMMDGIRKLNGCASEGQPWHKLGTIYPSAGGTPFVELVHDGGHPLWEEAPRLIVSFFKEHKK